MSLDYGKLAADGLQIVESALSTAPGASFVTIAITDAAALKDILAQLAANAPAIDAKDLDPNDRAAVDAQIETELAKS